MKRTETIRKIMLLTLIICAFCLINLIINKKHRKELSVIPDSSKYVYNVEKLEELDGKVKLTGWFFKVKALRNEPIIDADESSYKILLADVSDLGKQQKILGIETDIEYVKRYDVNDYFHCEYDYSDCGFQALWDENKLKQNVVYQVFFKIDKHKATAIASHVFIKNGELFYVNPNSLNDFSVEGTDLEDIVNSGTILVSNPEHGIYMIQNSDDLYWIADANASFMNNEKTYMQYQIETTQFEKLPLERLEGGWYWSNIGDIFENYEITHILNCGKYRVMVRKIPREYSVTQITVGYYDDEWIWRDDIKPIFSQLANP